MICKKIVKKSFRQSFDKTYSDEAVVQREIAEELVAQLAEQGCNFSSVLELGCGTGLLTSKLLSRFAPETVYLNDLTDTSQFITNLPETFTFLIGDGEKVDYPQDLDLICSNAVVQWFDSLAEHFSKAHDALNENGILAFSTFGPENMKEVLQLTGSGLSYQHSEELSAMLSSQFEVMVCKEFSRTLYFDSARDVLVHLKKTGVNAISRNSWSKTQYKDFCKSYGERFAKNGKFPLTYNPILFIARKA